MLFARGSIAQKKPKQNEAGWVSQLENVSKIIWVFAGHAVPLTSYFVFCSFSLSIRTQ